MRKLPEGLKEIQKDLKKTCIRFKLKWTGEEKSCHGVHIHPCLSRGQISLNTQNTDNEAEYFVI